MMIKAGVIGHPVAHSLSPKLHTHWLQHYHIDGEYKAYDVPPEKLEAFIRSMPEKGFAGCNVTVPHKEAALAFVDEVDLQAKAIGAINTIVVRGGKLFGSNTDVTGFVHNVEPHCPARRKAVMLGAGGAARAVMAALKQMGFQEIAVTNRTDEKANGLARQYGAHAVGWDQRNNLLREADMLVNTTSLGLGGQPPLDIDLSDLPKTALVTDIVYKPLMTPLLEQARARGNPVVDGLGMLLHQAVPGFEAWFGVRPVVTDELRDIILAS